MERDEVLNLKSFADDNKWKLEDKNGKIRTLPGACFEIPPPDTEVLETVTRYTQKNSSAVLCN